MLEAENLGGVLINSQHNFAWLTGGKSNGINLSAENGAFFLLARRDGKCFVLANNIEMPRLLREEVSAEDFEPVEFTWQEEKAAGDFVIKKAESLLADNKNLASDLFLQKEIRSIENLISLCRYKLTDAEIEIARKTRNELAKFNINSVVTLVGADERIGKYRHPIPTENIWKKVLLIVVCAKRNGLIASLSRIVCVGEIPSELKRKTEASAYIFAKLLSETKTEKSGANLYKIAADAYAEKGFADEINLHHQGGATGYKTRDWIIHPKSIEKVFPNQAFAWNPSITGTKAEETNLLINDKIEILTETPDFPQISVKIDGHEYFSPDILSL